MYKNELCRHPRAYVRVVRSRWEDRKSLAKLSQYTNGEETFLPLPPRREIHLLDIRNGESSPKFSIAEILGRESEYPDPDVATPSDIEKRMKEQDIRCATGIQHGRPLSGADIYIKNRWKIISRILVGGKREK